MTRAVGEKIDRITSSDEAGRGHQCRWHPARWTQRNGVQTQQPGAKQPAAPRQTVGSMSNEMHQLPRAGSSLQTEADGRVSLRGRLRTTQVINQPLVRRQSGGGVRPRAGFNQPANRRSDSTRHNEPEDWDRLLGESSEWQTLGFITGKQKYCDTRSCRINMLKHLKLDASWWQIHGPPLVSPSALREPWSSSTQMLVFTEDEVQL